MAKKTVKELVEELKKHYKDIEEFYNDPMTKACGCADDFGYDYSIKERRICASIIKHPRIKKGSKNYELAMCALEKFFP